MRFSALDGRRVAVWGAGVETRSFARMLRAHLPAARVAVVVLEDAVDAPELTADARVVGAADAVDAVGSCDVLIRSPGVSRHRPELLAIAANGLPITTPTGLWFAERAGRNTIGITATKGKSTTASLLAHLVAQSGRAVQLAGNIGRPALELLDGDPAELAVVELSSYQIADLPHGPQVAMASNLYREHLNWHLTEEAYARDKLRLLALPGVERCVVNVLSPDVTAAPRAVGPVFEYGAAPGWHVRPDGGIERKGGPTVARDDLPLRGDHNALNLCGALTALEALDIELPALGEAFTSFEGLPHRLQTVHEQDGVEWVDDSISTTPESAIAALRAFPDRPVLLIGGGFDRGQDYAELGAVAARSGTHVIALPTTGTRLAEAVRAAGGPVTETADLREAVATARTLVTSGTVVLLSPAAPSFNTHADYRARGDEFRALAVEPASASRP